ncbi:hypothetical protein KUTeg_001491 [Tegillarca granosa]|uniref:Temptin Cys/Cys disulfide domain-containing protein n=1 Tax=Tegillarca granosa TaxID=220873 RepID=A0ABQ9FRL1_TEGGR|nr:hypothetical protein KUTeg_001491 [Tegillarca granosa]
MFLLMVLRATNSFKYFQSKIPNGDRVPDVCFTESERSQHSGNGQDQRASWEGVGHLMPRGSGLLNAFGLDFKQNNFEWTKKFCETDSDNDGRSNGLELGDPDCSWKPGSNLNLTTSLSHPGICEPVHSELCRSSSKNDATACIDNKKPSCGAFNDTDVRRSRFVLSFTPVTTSGCGVFNLPQDRTYHLIAVSSRNIHKNIRRILVYGCDPKQTRINISSGCEHSQFEGCRYLLSELTKTESSQCYDKEFGIKVGRFGFKQIMYEWEIKENFKVTKGSYIELMYTKTLRKYDMGFAEIGSLYFSIPHNQSDHVVTASCSSECTRTLITSPIFLVFGATSIRDFGKIQYKTQ